MVSIVISALISFGIACGFYKKSINYSNRQANHKHIVDRLNNILQIVTGHNDALTQNMESDIVYIINDLKTKLDTLVSSKNKQDKVNKSLENIISSVTYLSKDTSDTQHLVQIIETIQTIKELITAKDCSKEIAQV